MIKIIGGKNRVLRCLAGQVSLNHTEPVKRLLDLVVTYCDFRAKGE
jgi:hypothetical protein